MLVSDENLQQYAWAGASGPDINSVPAVIESELVGSDLEVDIVATAAYGGALVSLDRPVPIINGVPLPWLKVVWSANPSQAAVLEARCDELDAMVIFPPATDPNVPIKNRYNLSTQLNLAEGGMEQIVGASGQWLDTGDKPGPLPADVFTDITVINHLDYTGQTGSVVSFAQGTAAAVAVPASEEGVSAETSNWSLPGQSTPQPCLHLQIQLDDNAVAAGFAVRYRCSVYWSDNPDFK